MALDLSLSRPAGSGWLDRLVGPCVAHAQDSVAAQDAASDADGKRRHHADRLTAPFAGGPQPGG
jgi:hypothetical protein